MREIVSEAEVVSVLEESKTVAVLGAHSSPIRPAFYVPDYLHTHGYHVLPVNERLVGQTLWGEPVRATLAELKVPVDVVDVFRRPDALMDHVADILAMDPLPKVVWLQQGIRHEAFTRRLVGAGISVIQDRCMLADHRRFGL